MKEIAQGIYSRFTALTGGNHNALYLSVNGQLFNTEADQEAVFPYIVFSFPTGNPEHTFTDEFENQRVQFSIFSTARSSIEVEDIRAKLMALYDWCALTLTGYTSIYMRRIAINRTKDERAWHVIVEYRVFAEKN